MDKSLLVQAYPWLLFFLLALCTGLLAASRKSIASALRPLLSRREAWLGGAICAAALLVRLFVYPATHQVYFDEFEHLDIARNIARGAGWAESLAGGMKGFDILQAPIWPGGFHAMLAPVFALFGFSEGAAYAFNATLGALTVGLLFLIGLVLFEDGLAAAIGAFLWAALPIHLRYSGATDLTVCSLFWIEGSILSLLFWRRGKSDRLGALCAACIVYAANVRPENLLLVPFFFAFAPRTRLRSRWVWAGGFLALVFIAPTVLIAMSNRSASVPGYHDSIATLATQLLVHLPGNLAFLDRSPSSWFLLPLAAFAIWRRRKTPSIPRALFILCVSYLFIYSAYHIGEFHRGSSDRYALPVLLPLVLLAAAGWRDLLGRLAGRFGIAGLLAVIFVAVSWPSYGKVDNERDEAEYRLIKDAAPLLAPDDYVVSFSPSAILTAARRPGLSPYLILEDPKSFTTSELILFKDQWWYERADDSQRLEKVLAGYARSPILLRNIEEREYGFWRLTKR